jgi:aerobic carbon-monoxide dehydrogenase small subunit
MTTITIELNGVRIADEVEPRLSLADFLRDRCGLTATHLGCEHGACGACTVLVDGCATRSCLALAAMCDGRSVATLEGLRDDPVMDVIRRHFHEGHALQCGFCTPGMLIAARDILQRLPQPDTATVRRELSGQICRCTGYANIVKAIVAAGQELAGLAEAAARDPVAASEHDVLPGEGPVADDSAAG